MRLRGEALQTRAGLLYYAGGLFSGTSYTIRGERIAETRRVALGKSHDVGSPEDADGLVVTADHPDVADHHDGARYFGADGPFSGKILRFEKVFCVAEMTIVDGWITRELEFYRSGRLETYSDKDETRFLEASWDEWGGLGSLHVVAGDDRLAVSFDAHGRLAQFEADGHNPTRLLSHVQALPGALDPDALLARGGAPEVELRGHAGGTVLERLVAAGGFVGANTVTLDGWAFSAADLRRIAGLKGVRSIRIAGDQGRLESPIEFVRREYPHLAVSRI